MFRLLRLPWLGSASHATVVAARNALKQCWISCVTGVEPHLYAAIGLPAHAGTHIAVIEFSNDAAARRVLNGAGQSFVSHSTRSGGERAVARPVRLRGGV